MKRPQFVINQIYHICHHGIEERKIFQDTKDYFRFIHDLFEFNDIQPAQNIYYKLSQLRSYEVQPRKIGYKRDLLVEILSFSLMPNHYHLILKEIRKNGIIKFMQKLNTGYTMYFNQKYQRRGHLFQGRYKVIPVEKESHLIHLPFYLHFNCLDLIEPEWRNGKIKNFKKAVKYLNSYRWSSHLDYLGKKNFPSIIQQGFFNKIFKNPENYKKMVENWLKQMEWEEIKEIVLE